ncbi:hypothetical protein ACFQU7_06455 [Pseudoroseomonas wenyumeiae]
MAGDSKLDTAVLLEFLALLLDKALGGLLPLRFMSFALVGASASWCIWRCWAWPSASCPSSMPSGWRPSWP